MILDWTLFIKCLIYYFCYGNNAMIDAAKEILTPFNLIIFLLLSLHGWFKLERKSSRHQKLYPIILGRLWVQLLSCISNTHTRLHTREHTHIYRCQYYALGDHSAWIFIQWMLWVSWYVICYINTTFFEDLFSWPHCPLIW